MPLLLLLGICAGFAASFDARAFLFFTGGHPFDLAPFLLALAAAVAAAGKGRRAKQADPLIDRLFFAAAAAVPFLLFLADSATHHFAYLDGNGTPAQFLLRALTAGVLLAPAAALFRFSSAGGRWKAKGQDPFLSVPLLIAGVAIGVWAEHSASDFSALGIALPITLILFAAAGWLTLRRGSSAGRKSKPAAAKQPEPAATGAQEHPPYRAAERLAMQILVFTISFVCAAWFFSRSLLLAETVNPPEAYALHMLLLLLAGIAAGWFAAGFFSRGAPRRADQDILLLLLLLIAASALLLALLYNGVYHAQLFLDFQNGSASRPTQYLLALLMIFIPALLAGAALSLARHHLRGNGGSAELILAGAAAGILFLLLRPAPAWSPLLEILCICIAGAAILHASAFGAWRRIGGACALLASAGAVWSFSLSGDRPVSLVDTNRFTLIAEKAGADGLHTLVRYRDYDDPFTALLYNHGATLAQSSIQFAGLYRRMAFLPMIAQGNPRSILYVGIGSAEPLNAISRTGATAEVVEEDAALIALSDSAARLQPRNIRSGRVEFHCERPLPFLARQGRSWDLILRAEPFSKTEIGVADFSTAWYEAARDRLSPDGVYAEWLPLGRFDAPFLRDLLATVAAVFPRAELWFGDADPRTGMACVIASRKPVRIGGAFFASASGRTREDLRFCGLDGPADACSWFALSDESLRSWAAGGKPIGGLRPAHLPRRESADIESGGARMYEAFFARRDTPAWDPSLPDTASAAIERALREEPVIFAAETSIALDRRDSARAMLDAVLKENPGNAKARILFAALLTYEGALKAQKQEFAGARILLEEAVRLHGLNSYLCRLLMIAAYKLGDRPAANKYINEGLYIDRLNAGLYDNAATLFANDSLLAGAEQNYRRALAINPRDVDIYCNYASAMFNSKNEWDAVRILDRAGAQCPNPSRAWYLQGVLYNAMQKPREAMDSMRRFLRTAMPNDPRIQEAASYVDQGEKAMKGQGL